MAKQRPMVRISDVILKIARKFDIEIKLFEHTINSQWEEIVETGSHPIQGLIL